MHSTAQHPAWIILCLVILRGREGGLKHIEDGEEEEEEEGKGKGKGETMVWWVGVGWSVLRVTGVLRRC